MSKLCLVVSCMPADTCIQFFWVSLFVHSIAAETTLSYYTLHYTHCTLHYTPAHYIWHYTPNECVIGCVTHYTPTWLEAARASPVNSFSRIHVYAL